MDFTFMPDILKDATPEAERLWSLKRMGELLSIAYQLAEHPILKGWRGYDPIDIFMLAMNNLEKYKRFNRTLVERTISQSQYYSQIESGPGVLIIRSKGIEFGILDVESFLLVANKLFQTSDAELQDMGTAVEFFRLTGSGRLEASIVYFMNVCNNLIELTYKHALADQLRKTEGDDEKVKYLLRQKTNLQQQEDQFDPKVFKGILDSIEIELGYHKNVKEYLELSSEVKAVLDQFLAERKARISNTKLLGYLLEENLDAFCKDLSELVLRAFSYYDLGGEEPERVYHYFLLGVFTGFKDYQVESNKESGKGRFDILLIPDTLEYKGVVVEVKRSLTNREEAIQAMLDEAMKQIVDNKYALELKIRGHPEYIGIAAVFYGKTLFLKHQQFILMPNTTSHSDP